MAGHRPERVAHLLQEAITEMLQRGQLKDPRIAGATIAEVQVTKDLKIAKVFVQVLSGAEQRAKTVEGLQSAEGFIRRELRPALSLKQVPQLLFREDETAERADRVLGLLAQLERDRKAPVEPPKEKDPAPAEETEPKPAATKVPTSAASARKESKAAKAKPKTKTKAKAKKEPKSAAKKKAPAAKAKRAPAKKGKKQAVAVLDDSDEESTDDESE